MEDMAEKNKYDTEFARSNCIIEYIACRLHGQSAGHLAPLGKLVYLHQLKQGSSYSCHFSLFVTNVPHVVQTAKLLLEADGKDFQMREIQSYLHS